jgi:HEAT repeat protein
MPRYSLIFLALQFALALPGIAQDGPDYAGCGKDTRIIYTCNGECGMPGSSPADLHPGASDLLQTRYAVKLDKEDLRAALSSSEVQVRYLAAWLLADAGDKDAVLGIFQTFEAESDPRPKAYLACALAELGDRRGVEALHQFCKSDALPEDLRLDVVRFLVEIHETPCITPVVEALKGGPPYNWQAQAIIPYITGLSPGESAHLRALLVGLLSEQGTGARMVAAQTLSQMHDSSAIPALQAALANESSPPVRNALQDALKRLQADQH